MASLEVDCEDRLLLAGLARVVIVTGEIDSSSCRDFDARVGDFLEGCTLGVLDLSGTTYVNSTGMTLLMKYTDALREAGGMLVIAGLRQEVEAVLAEVGFLQAFNLAPDAEAGLKRLEGGEAGDGAAAGQGAFPAHVTCVECKAPLVAAQPGHYSCPRCQIYFEVGADGQTQSFPFRSAQTADLSFPCLPEYVDVARAAAASVAKALDIPSVTSGAIDRAVDEAIGLYAGKAGEDSRRIRVFVAADDREFTIAFLVTDPALILTEDDKRGLTVRTIRGIVDELDIQNLSPEGQVVKLVKRLEY